MKSLRLYLITSVLSAMTLLIFLSALHGYYKSAAAAEELLDKQLMEMAQMLSLVRVMAPLAGDTHTVTETGAYQIWRDNRLMFRSENALEQPMVAYQAGFRDVNFGGYRWRCFAYHNVSNQRWVMVAQRLDIRNQLVDEIIIESVLPTLLILPIALLTIWLLVGYGLKPIQDLAQQLQRKQAHDLDPVALRNPLKELNPLVRSTNALLLRLQSALDREKRFSADAAHELRTPISVLKVHLHNLSIETGQDNAHIRQLQAGVERMEHLVAQILALYRSSPDQYVANFQPIDLTALAQSIIAQQYAIFADKAQHIALLGAQAWLQGDAFTLESLLSNLLINANKFTPVESEIVVRIRIVAENIELRVEDSGPGIPKDQYQRIFDRFYRLHGDQHTSGVPGCGLGLSIVQHIVQLHNGKIHLEHAPFDSGLAVVIQFPQHLEAA